MLHEQKCSIALGWCQEQGSQFCQTNSGDDLEIRDASGALLGQAQPLTKLPGKAKRNGSA